VRLDFRDERGQSAVEFALIVPVFVLFLSLVIYAAVAFNGWIDATHLANAAARYAAVGTEEPEGSGSCVAEKKPAGACLTKWVSGQADSTFVKNAEVTICRPEGKGKLEVGKPVEVKLKFTYNWAPLFETLNSKGESKSVMRVEVASEKEYLGC
jgi:hypothetical protein